MSLDGITTHFLAHELDTLLSGGRIDKVYQPSRYDIYLLIRSDSQNYRVLLSANPAGPRIHVSTSMRENPLLPPTFCMLLRKHLQGARILEISSPSYERIVEIRVQTTDEIGDSKDKRLIIEMMGRYSNIILLNSENRIFDSLLHVDFSMSRVREIMPARIYTYPPEQGKIDPEKAYNLAKQNTLPLLPDALGRPVEKALQESLLGFSPELCRELCFLSGLDPRKGIRQLTEDEVTRLCEASARMFSRILTGDIQPAAYALTEGAQLHSFHSLLLNDLGKPKYYPSISEAMDAVYRQKDFHIDFEQKKKELVSYIKSSLDHAIRRQTVHSAELDACRDMDRDQLFGSLLLQNAYQISKGADSFCAMDYAKDPYETFEIPLNPTWTAAQNAQSFFRKYAKCKAKKAAALSFLEEDDRAVAYLMSLSQAADIAAEEDDLIALREEMRESGLMDGGKRQSGTERKNGGAESSHPGKSKTGSSGSRAIRAAGKAAALRHTKKSAAKPVSSSSSTVGFRRYDGPDGSLILCGRNNLQNDQLTLKTAAPDDLWFHVQKMPGTHVVLRSADGGRMDFSDDAILKAAKTAAFFSRTMARIEKSRSSDPRNQQEDATSANKLKIPVDYCPVKNVRKPPKSKPGMVIYDHYKTLYVSAEDPAKSL